MNFNLLECVKQTIIDNELINEGEDILVAVSGGPDSIALLYILNLLKDELGYRVNVAHVNHKIRKEADDERIYVENFCRSINVPFYYLEKDVISEAKEHKMGIEEYARKIRYDFFLELKDKYNFDKIAIAHNLNDKIETILLNMIRGCSLKGLIGLEYKNSCIIRPMIDVYKSDILEFLKSENIKFCIDKSNFDNTYTRNKIRLELIPYIEKNINPSFIESVNRMSKLIYEDEIFIDKFADKIANESIISSENDNIIFNFENIIKSEDAIKKRVIRKIINNLMKNVQGIEKKHILDIMKLLENNKTSKKYIIGNKFTITILKKNIAKIYLNY